MAVGKRLSKVAREFNVGISTITDFLHKKGFEIDTNPNTKITDDMYSLLEQEYKSDSKVRKESEKLGHHFSGKPKKESISIQDIRDDLSEGETSVEKKEEPEIIEEKPKADVDFKVVGKIDLEEVAPKKKSPEKKVEEKKPVESAEKEEPPVKEEKKPEKKKEPEQPELGLHPYAINIL